MKTKLIIFLLFIANSVMAQRDNEFQIRLGYGVAAYATDIEWTYDLDNVNVTHHEDDGAVAAHIPLEIRYELHERFNLGLDLKFGKYLYDPDDDNTGKSNSFAIAGIGVEFNLLNRSNSRIYLGAGINAGRVMITETFADDANGTYTDDYVWSGGGFKVNTGIMYFIAGSGIGINFNIGYDSHKFELKSVERDGAEQDIDNITGTLRAAGPEINLGLVIRIR